MKRPTQTVLADEGSTAGSGRQAGRGRPSARNCNGSNGPTDGRRLERKSHTLEQLVLRDLHAESAANRGQKGTASEGFKINEILICLTGRRIDAILSQIAAKGTESKRLQWIFKHQQPTASA